MTLNVEKQNDVVWTWLIASERSGVKTMKELAGKTIALNAFGALCELQFREHLAKAGVPWSAVKPIVLPVPQMPAALELGNADAACVFEPIYTAAKMSPNIKAVTLATGMIADMEKFGAISLEGVYAREDWLEKNTDLARKIVKVVRAGGTRSEHSQGCLQQLDHGRIPDRSEHRRQRQARDQSRRFQRARRGNPAADRRHAAR